MKENRQDRSSPDSGVAFLTHQSSEITIETESCKKITFHPDEDESKSDSSEETNENFPVPKYGQTDSRWSLKSSVSSMSTFMSRQVDRIKPNAQNQATCFAISSGVMMTMYSAFYGWIEDAMDISTVLILRGLIQIISMAILNFMTSSKFGPLPPSNDEPDAPPRSRVSAYFHRHWFMKAVILMSMASFVGGIRLSFIFCALRESPMGSVHSIIQGAPVLVMVFGHFFLGDRLTIIRGISALGLIGGIFLIAKPDSFTNMSDEDHGDVVGYCFAVGALILSAAGTCLTKPLSSTFSRLSISFYLGICALLVGLFMNVTIEGHSPKFPVEPRVWLIAFFVSILGVSQQLCLIAAVKVGSPTRVTMIRSMQIALSFVVQVHGLQDPAGSNEIIGAGLILLTVAIMTFEKQIRAILSQFCCKNSSNKADEPLPVMTEKPEKSDENE